MQIAIYARVSTSRQAENDLSIPDQLRQVREWAQRSGHLIVREYVEPGASATDDKRPVFQQMVLDAEQKPAPFGAIVIHSLSRFFRDSVQFGVYERRLKRLGIKVISITQQTADDAAGEMARKLFSLFDEYQSVENSKHTSRAMQENARRGYFNGSAAPYGYKAVATDVMGARGRKKKVLVIEEEEATVVRKMYALYLHGDQGRTMGIKEIVKYLTLRGITMRGRPWRIQKVHDVLSSRAYLGEHNFNVRDSKTGTIRPPAEWITVHSDPIIDAATFDKVRQIREDRSPKKNPPMRVGSPTLLAGLLKCACGARLTLTTGKYGQYRYYKCTSRMAKGGSKCTSRILPADWFDDLVLDCLAARVLNPERLHAILMALKQRIRQSKEGEQTVIQELNRQHKSAEDRLSRLYQAIESGMVPVDGTLQQRIKQLQTARDAVLIDLANARKQVAPSIEQITPPQIAMFSEAMHQQLRDKGFAKRYLQLLVDEIRVGESDATIVGSELGLLEAISAHKKIGTCEQVPIFISKWRASHDKGFQLAESPFSLPKPDFVPAFVPRRLENGEISLTSSPRFSYKIFGGGSWQG